MQNLPHGSVLLACGRLVDRVAMLVKHHWVDSLGGSIDVYEHSAEKDKHYTQYDAEWCDFSPFDLVVVLLHVGLQVSSKLCLRGASAISVSILGGPTCRLRYGWIHWSEERFVEDQGLLRRDAGEDPHPI